MIQNGIHFSPILGQNQFELQNRVSLDWTSLSWKSDSFFLGGGVILVPNPAEEFIESEQGKLD